MITINERTVELDDSELAAKELFEGYLDKGMTIPWAAMNALNRTYSMDPGELAGGHYEFATWLSDGTVYRRGSRYRLTPEWKKAPVWAGRS